MLLHEYLDGIQSIIERYSRASLILGSDVSTDFRTEKIGIIRGTIDFIDESSLHFTEYLDLRYGTEKLTYSYHYQGRDGKLIFRYDNAIHKQRWIVKIINTFPTVAQSPLKNRRSKASLSKSWIVCFSKTRRHSKRGSDNAKPHRGV